MEHGKLNADTSCTSTSNITETIIKLLHIGSYGTTLELNAHSFEKRNACLREERNLLR